MGERGRGIRHGVMGVSIKEAGSETNKKAKEK